MFGGTDTNFGRAGCSVRPVVSHFGRATQKGGLPTPRHRWADRPVRASGWVPELQVGLARPVSAPRLSGGWGYC